MRPDTQDLSIHRVGELAVTAQVGSGNPLITIVDFATDQIICIPLDQVRKLINVLGTAACDLVNAVVDD